MSCGIECGSGDVGGVGGGGEGYREFSRVGGVGGKVFDGKEEGEGKE